MKPRLFSVKRGGRQILLPVIPCTICGKQLNDRAHEYGARDWHAFRPDPAVHREAMRVIWGERRMTQEPPTVLSVSISKNIRPDAPAARYFASCACGWHSYPSKTFLIVAEEAGVHLLKCELGQAHRIDDTRAVP